MAELPRDSVLVRTWFGDDAAWDSLIAEIETPSTEGFLAGVITVDDREFAGLSPEGLAIAQRESTIASGQGGAIVSFLADETTLCNADHPILAVWVLPKPADHSEDGTEQRPFRVIPSRLWSVENNINLANMDWQDFTGALDDDGVFRGFPSPSPGRWPMVQWDPE